MQKFEHNLEHHSSVETESTLLQDFLHDPEARDYLLELKDSARRSFLTVVAVAGIFLMSGGESFAQAKGDPHPTKTEKVPDLLMLKILKNTYIEKWHTKTVRMRQRILI